MQDDKWLPMAACNDLTKREAQVLIKRKFPSRQSTPTWGGPPSGWVWVVDVVVERLQLHLCILYRTTERGKRR